jgi:hypothetical protein
MAQVIDGADDGLADLGREDQDMQRPPELTPHGPSPPFKVVSDLFEEISQSAIKRAPTHKPADRKKAYMSRFFDVRARNVLYDPSAELAHSSTGRDAARTCFP